MRIGEAMFNISKSKQSASKRLNPEYAFDHLLLPKMPLKLGVNSVSLTRHKDSLCLARETANFFGLLALMTKFKCVIRVKNSKEENACLGNNGNCLKN